MSGDNYHKRSPPPHDLANNHNNNSNDEDNGSMKRDGVEHRRNRSRSPMRRHHHHQRRSRSRSTDARRRRRHHSRSRSRDRGGRRDERRHREQDRESRRHSRSRSRGRRSRSRSHTNHSRSHHHHQHQVAERTDHKRHDISLENLPLPKQQPQPGHHPFHTQQRDSIGAYYDLDTEEPIDKERIHREIEEKLRATLAKEGKVYPPPKVEASHPVFANDGSFLEIFKKMQEAQQSTTHVGNAPTVAMPLVAVPTAVGVMPSAASTASSSTSTMAAYVAASAAGRTAPPPPLVGRRRGGKILKTGLVAKQKVQNETNADPKDFWSLYLAEVNKYKSHACESDTGNRPLVK